MAQTSENSDAYNIEDRFQRHLELVYAANLESASNDQLTEFLDNNNVNKEDIKNFLERLPDGIIWKVFDTSSIPQAIGDINSSTPDIYLRKIQDRLERGLDPDIDIYVVVPNSFTPIYFQIFLLPSGRTHLDNNRHCLISTSDGGLEENYHNLPTTFVYTLEYDNKSYLILLLGRLLYDNEATSFLVVKVLDKEEYWAIFDYELDLPGTDSDDPPKVSPESRRAKFPGLDGEISIGKLEGLFEQDNVTLRPFKKTDGFYIYLAGRYDGVIRPVTKDLEVVY